MIRFKKDDGSKYPEWKKGAFEEFFSINSGYGFKAAEYVDSGIPIVKIDNVGYGKVKWDNISYLPDEYLETYRSIVLKKDDIVLALNRPITNKQLKIAKLKDVDVPAILYQRVGKIDCKDIDREFGFQMLGKDIFRFVMEMSVGSDQPFISTERLKKMEVNIPCREEQEKIADFLSSLDDIIQVQEEEIYVLEEQKKGIMQKLFNREVRFKADDGSEYPEWKEKELGEIAKRVTRKNKNNETNLPLTISSIDGLVDQSTYFNKIIASRDMSGYYLLKKGEFAYNKSYSAGYDYGSIKRLDRYDMGALSTLYICFSLKDDVNSDYMVRYFDSLIWNREIGMFCAEGARNHGLLNIAVEDFFKIKIQIPMSHKEQQKIVDCLSSYDEAIQIKKDKLEVWKEIKKGLLQQMFV